MYNFELMDDEDVVKIFDEIFIRQGENEKYTTIVLTNKRLLFLEYLTPNEGNEVLRIARGANYFRYKEVYYQIDLKDIESVVDVEDELYTVTLQNEMSFDFDDKDLYELLK